MPRPTPLVSGGLKPHLVHHRFPYAGLRPLTGGIVSGPPPRASRSSGQLVVVHCGALQPLSHLLSRLLTCWEVFQQSIHRRHSGATTSQLNYCLSRKKRRAFRCTCSFYGYLITQYYLSLNVLSQQENEGNTML